MDPVNTALGIFLVIAISAYLIWDLFDVARKEREEKAHIQRRLNVGFEKPLEVQRNGTPDHITFK